MVKELGIVFLGGGVGATFRFSIGLMSQYFALSFWTGTLISNLLGCLIFFLWANISSTKGPVDLFIKVGLLGALTTFSTFCYELVVLLKRGQMQMALCLFLLNILGGVLMGIWIFRQKLI